MTKYKVLDSNILLHGADNLLDLGKDGSTIVLPEVVLDEIDTKKSIIGELGYQARQFARYMSKAKVVNEHSSEDYVALEFTLNSVKILVVTPKKYPNYSDTVVSVINDRKIIYTASILPGDVTFYTNDVGCRIKALSIGIKTTDLKVVETTEFEFTKRLDVPDDKFRVLHNSKIVDVDKDYSMMYYNYVFHNPETGQSKLGQIINGTIQVIGKDTEKELRKQNINPINSAQLLLSNAIQNPTNDIIVVESKAGTGKDLMAFSNAMRLVDLGQYEGIVYIRNSVNDLEREEEVGYLSTNEAKFETYLHPVYDTLDFIARSKYPRKKGTSAEQYEVSIEENVTRITSKYNIQPMITLGLRGRTFHDSIIILDEGQNLSSSAFQKVLTRVGKNCKVIILGSNRQIDHPYITKYNNGLSVILDAATRGDAAVKLYAIKLEAVARGKITEFGERIFEDKSNE